MHYHQIVNKPHLFFRPQRVIFKQSSQESATSSSQQSVTELRRELESKISNSKIRSEADKKNAKNWLENNPKSFDVKELKIAIDLCERVDTVISGMIDQYTKKVQNAVKEGVSSKVHEKEHIEWFRSQSFEKKMEYLKKCDLDDPKRKEATVLFKKLPAEIQSGITKEYNAARFEDRLKIITKANEAAKLYALIPSSIRKTLVAKIEKSDLQTMQGVIINSLTPHQKLKAEFLKLDEKIQEKHREKFKEMNLKERAEFLRKVKDTENSGENNEAEQKSAREEKFRNKMMDLINRGLFSHRSFLAYDLWFKKLGANEQKSNLKNSDIDDPKRVKVYKEFYELPEKIRTPQREKQFLNADIEGRSGIINELKGNTATMGEIKYPERTVKFALDETLEDKSLQQKRVLFTMMQKVQRFTRRAEIQDGQLANQVSQGKYTDEERDKKEDDLSWIDLTSINEDKSKREQWRKTIVNIESTQGEEKAKIRGTGLYNQSSKMVGAEEFDSQVVNHLKEDLLTGLLRIASERLPGIDQSTLRKQAEKMELNIDLNEAKSFLIE